MRGRNLAGPGSPPLSKTTFRRTNFANWLLTGTVKGNRNQLTKPSIFNGEDVPTIPSTVRDILLGNFRSVLWYKLDSNTGNILTGFTVDPFSLWKTIKTKVMGALLNQFNGVCRQDPKVFVRDETIKFIDLLSWGGIEWDYASQFPLIMARGGSLHLNSPSVESQEPSFWAKNDPEDEDFIEILLREEPDTQPYYALEES